MHIKDFAEELREACQNGASTSDVIQMLQVHYLEGEEKPFLEILEEVLEEKVFNLTVEEASTLRKYIKTLAEYEGESEYSYELYGKLSDFVADNTLE